MRETLNRSSHVQNVCSQMMFISDVLPSSYFLLLLGHTPPAKPPLKNQDYTYYWY